MFAVVGWAWATFAWCVASFWCYKYRKERENVYRMKLILNALYGHGAVATAHTIARAIKEKDDL